MLSFCPGLHDLASSGEVTRELRGSVVAHLVIAILDKWEYPPGISVLRYKVDLLNISHGTVGLL